MKERMIVSATTLIASLTAYFYARNLDKDAVPYVMIGGFIGAFAGEVISNLFKNDDDNTPGASPAVA